MIASKKSEMAGFRQEQQGLEEAALRGLHGLSSGSSRMERGANYILGLIQAGKHEDAQMLMEAKTWADIEVEVLEGGETGNMSHYDTILA